jgi:hypothetical protein
MTALGARAVASFSAEPDIKAWADGTMLNPAGSRADRAGSTTLEAVLDRLARHVGPGLARLRTFSGLDPEAG